MQQKTLLLKATNQMNLSLTEIRGFAKVEWDAPVPNDLTLNVLQKLLRNGCVQIELTDSHPEVVETFEYFNNLFKKMPEEFKFIDNRGIRLLLYPDAITEIDAWQYI